MSNAQILVVEDEAIVAKDLTNRLVEMGYQVPAVSMTGREAVAKTEETHPDLILMDIRLKGDMDGVDAASEIRRHQDVPVIYLTAYSDQNTLDRAKQTAPYGYVLKPFVERELQTAIEIALYKHQAERDREQLILELEEALSQVRTLSGLLPICASCKKIRDDRGYWNQLESYLTRHSGVEFTHSYCPDCEAKLRAQMGLPKTRSRPVEENPGT
ncbi:MAG: response regulator [Verrucomicrobiota bacterium]